MRQYNFMLLTNQVHSLLTTIENLYLELSTMPILILINELKQAYNFFFFETIK